jgi:hypothetical protein
VVVGFETDPDLLLVSHQATLASLVGSR